jgi:hypothetical protein
LIIQTGKKRDLPTASVDYAVGYCRPPLATRFKPGNTAAAGRRRPRGAPDLAALLAAALNARTVVVGKDGRRRRMAKRELGFARLADKFAAADPAIAKLLLGLLSEIECRRPSEPEVQPASDEADKLVIANFIAGLREP